jgi:hypothetical protein
MTRQSIHQCLARFGVGSLLWLACHSTTFADELVVAHAEFPVQTPRGR